MCKPAILLTTFAFTALLATPSWGLGVCDDDNVRERICDPNQKSVYSRRPINLQRVWLMMAVFDADERESTPAIVDIGFLDDGETRTPAATCNVNYVPSKFANNIDCGSSIYGEYDGIMLATGNDAYKLHGNNMKNIVGATLNDGGAAGVAGQVAVPSLYRLDDVQSYLFELGPTIIHAVDAGSSVINISGGFPCTIQLNTPPNSQTPNLCTSSGRATFCQTAELIGALPGLASLLCLTAELEGDLENNIAVAANYAAAAGVPIVASAGNISTEWLTSVVDLTGIINWTASNSDAADWDIIPATVGPVIAAGAAGTSAPYANQDFHGPRVNIWAPFDDTSPAAAFVSGLIALAQTINPALSPANSSLGQSELAALPGTLRDMLMDTAHTPDELTATCRASEPDCMTDPTGERRNLVNPYRFLRAAAAGAVPDFENLGYVDTFDSFHDDLEPANNALPDASDVDLINQITIAGPANATTTSSGTIFYVPGEPARVDQDVHIIEFAGSSDAQVDGHIALTYLSGYGELVLTSPHDFLTLRETVTGPVETTRIYDTPAFAQGGSLPVVVRGQSATDDNLYKLSVVRGLNLRPNPDQFDRSGDNDSVVAATQLARNPVISLIDPNTPHWEFSADALTIHSVDDVDHFTFTSPPTPNDGRAYRLHVEPVVDNPMVRLRASIGGAAPTTIGDTGIQVYGDQTVVFFAEPRYPGLVLSYNLSGSVSMSPVEYNPFPDKAYADLEYFLEAMVRHVNDRMPENIGCPGCLRLASEGMIQTRANRHAVANYRGVPRDARSANYLVLDKPTNVTLALTQGHSRGMRVQLFDVRGQRIARSDRRDPQINATLKEGAYLVVITGGQRGKQNVRYEIKREPF